METGLYLGLSLAVVISAIGYLIVLYQDNQKLKYVLKPGTMLFIILIAVVGLKQTDSYGWLILIGLFFSVIGDVFLLSSSRFLMGLISFFIAHIFYIIAIGCNFKIGFSSGLAFILVVIGLIFFLLLRKEVMREGGVSLLSAVLLYICIICTMMYFSISSEQPIIIVAGALFFLSDAILAWNLFIRNFNWGEHMVMITYYSAQYLFAISLSL